MRRLGAGIAAILALAALAYIPAVGGGFIWDDDYYVTENPTLRTADGLRAIWTDPGATPQYYPLTHTSFWIEYRLWGLEPAGYHVVNVLLHALAAVVLWRLLHALGVPGAWLAAAVFAVHPVHVESVAWITERKNVLSGMLYLASATCWVRYLGLDSEQERDPAAGWAAAGAVLFVGALLSKTVTASLPMSLLLVAFWKGKRLRAGALVLLGAMLAAGVLMGSLTSWLERNQIGAVDGPWDLGWWERVGVAGRAWWFYLGKLAWPSDLSFVYPRWTPSASVSTLALAAAAALTPLAALAFGRFHRRGPAVALLHYTVALAPALGFFNVYPMRYSFVADHFCYLASIGPISLACAFGATAARRFALPQPARVVIAGALVAALSAAAWHRAEVFRGPEELWTDTLERNPAAWLAHNNLGARRAMEGRDREAKSHLREVLVWKPDHAGARANLGRLALRRGETSEALRWLEEAVRLDPDDIPARISLGDARLENGAPDAARRIWTEVLRIEPRNPLAHHRLGMLRLAGGEPAAAADHLRVAARAIPDDPTIRIGLGTALARRARYREAAEELRVAVALDPGSADARLRLAAALGALGDLDGSEAQFREVLRLDSGSEPARRGLDRLRRRRDRGAPDAGGSRIENP